MWLFPTWKQFKGWNLPSKVSYVSGAVAIVVLPFQLWPKNEVPAPAVYKDERVTSTGQSGGITAQQVTINNYTINQVQSNIVAVAADKGDALMASYPLGSVVFGMADRKVVYEAKPRLVRMNTDTDLVVGVNGGTVGVQINHLKLSEADDDTHWNQFGNMLVTLPYKEGKAVKLPMKQRFRDRLASFWIEILDKKKGIFVLGLRDEGPISAP